MRKQVKRFKQRFHQEGYLDGKSAHECSTSLAVREIQSRNTMDAPGPQATLANKTKSKQNHTGPLLCCCWENETEAAVLGNSLVLCYKVKHTPALRLSTPTPRCLPKRNKNLKFTQNLETMETSLNWYTDKTVGIHTTQYETAVNRSPRLVRNNAGVSHMHQAYESSTKGCS